VADGERDAVAERELVAEPEAVRDADAEREPVGEPVGVRLTNAEAEELRVEELLFEELTDVVPVLVEVAVLEFVEVAVAVREVVADKLLFAD
jgi:hypothetical protein